MTNRTGVEVAERADEPTGRLWRFVLAASLLVIVVIIAFLGLQLTEKLNSLREAPRDSVQYAIFQVEGEFRKMQSAWSEMEARGADAFPEFATRFDIFYSRVKLLQTSGSLALLRADPVFGDGIGALDAFISETSQIIDHGYADALAQQGEIHRRLDEIDATVRSVTLHSLDILSAQSDAERSELQTLLLTVSVLVLVLIGCITTFAFVLSRKMSELRQRQRELTESKSRLQATVSGALDAVIVADRDGRILDWNDSATECFGFTYDRALGTEMAELIIPPTSREAHRSGMRRYLSTGEKRVIGNRLEVMALHAKGHEFPIELTVGTTESSQGPIFIASIRDISDRRAKQKELRQIAEQAKAADRAKTAFLAVMSHEMRTPLNGVLGALELMRDSSLAENQRKLLETAHTSGELLLDLINDVLDLTKMDAGKMDLQLKDFDLAATIEQVRTILDPDLKARGNEISISIDASLPSYLHADQGRLRQVILNLVGNANNFTSNGSIRIDCRRDQASDNGEILFVSVTDTGIGIPEENIGSLFEDFSQVDSTSSRRQGGTGLGLGICRRIVAAMNGEIGVSSTLGKGSQFNFTIPLVEEKNGPHDLAHLLTRAESSSAAAKGRILLAEDNRTNAMIARQMLESAGHEVVHAENGEEAVKTAAAGDFDLIFMDISMPEMDGIEASKLIRKFKGHAGEVPIVALTASTAGNDLARCRLAGMQDCLTKPVRKADLLAMVGRFLMSGTNEVVDTDEDRKRVPVGILDAASLRELGESLGAETLEKVLDQFLDETRDTLDLMANAAAAKDGDRLRKAAHSLVGSAATIGATRLAESARQIEAQCLDGNTPNAVGKLDDLMKIAEDSIHEVNSYRIDLTGLVSRQH